MKLTQQEDLRIFLIGAGLPSVEEISTQIHHFDKVLNQLKHHNTLLLKVRRCRDEQDYERVTQTCYELQKTIRTISELSIGTRDETAFRATPIGAALSDYLQHCNYEYVFYSDWKQQQERLL